MRKSFVIGVVLAIGIGAAAISPAHAEWHNGQWGHWGWHKGAWVFVVEPYSYAPYPYGYAPPPPPPPPAVYYAPPPPVYYAPPPVVVGPSFGISIGVH